MAEQSDRANSQGPKRVYSRPDLEWTDDELELWAEGFVNAVLADPDPDKAL